MVNNLGQKKLARPIDKTVEPLLRTGPSLIMVQVRLSAQLIVHLVLTYTVPPRI